MTARAVCSIIPEIAAKVSEIVGFPWWIHPARGRIMRKVVAKKQTNDGKVCIRVTNYTSSEVASPSTTSPLIRRRMQSRNPTSWMISVGA